MNESLLHILSLFCIIRTSSQCIRLIVNYIIGYICFRRVSDSSDSAAGLSDCEGWNERKLFLMNHAVHTGQSFVAGLGPAKLASINLTPRSSNISSLPPPTTHTRISRLICSTTAPTPSLVVPAPPNICWASRTRSSRV